MDPITDEEDVKYYLGRMYVPKGLENRLFRGIIFCIMAKRKFKRSGRL